MYVLNTTHCAGDWTQTYIGLSKVPFTSCFLMFGALNDTYIGWIHLVLVLVFIRPGQSHPLSSLSLCRCQAQTVNNNATSHEI